MESTGLLVEVDCNHFLEIKIILKIKIVRPMHELCFSLKGMKVY